MRTTVEKPRRILWANVTTVLGATLLIGAEVFGAAYAGGWAISRMFGLGDVGTLALQALFMAGGLAVMAQFVRSCMRVEPFTARG